MSLVAWTDETQVQAALGPSVVFAGDPYAGAAVDAANAWCFRKRVEAGYLDDATDGAPAPSPDVAFGATLYAVALWRERAATDTYPSFQQFDTFTPAGGSLGQIRRLLGIGRAAVDAPLTVPQVNLLRRGRRRR